MGRLRTNPSSLNFGEVISGETADLDVTLQNISHPFEEISITALSFSGTDAALFTVQSAPSLPVALMPGESQVITIRFAPVSTGVKSATLVVDSDAWNAPVDVNLAGSGVAAGTKTLSVDPSSWDFGSIKTSTSSDEKLLVITNTGTTDVQVTTLNFASPFAAGSTAPGLPATITPGNTLSFGAIFSPSVAGYQEAAAGASVVSDAAASPFDVLLSGTGFNITPAFELTDNIPGVFLGFVLGSVVVVKKADPTDLNCEETALFKKLHDFNLPGFEKTLHRTRFRYENLGVATVNVKATSVRDSVNVNKVIGTGGADEKVRNSIADLNISHDLIEIEFSRAASSGPLSITEYTPRFEPKGEVIEGV